MNIFLFLGLLFLAVFLLGHFIERFKVPWVFSALLIGAALSLDNPFEEITATPVFEFLGQLGMYFLLFIIGLEIDLDEMKKRRKFIIKASFTVIFLEALFGTLLIHFLFHYDWMVSGIVALSFATVGEAILVPILDAQKVINTKLGQLIIGIGTFDDLFEVLTLLLVSVMFEKGGIEVFARPAFVIVGLTVLLIAFGIFRKEAKRFDFLDLESLFIFVLFVLFIFMGIGEIADATSLSALLAGVAVTNFVPTNKMEPILQIIKAICYGFFAPLFFVWVGLSLDIPYLVSSPLLVLSIIVISSLSKLLGIYLVGRKDLGIRQTILTGIGLSVRFSTSIIIIKILFDHQIIDSTLYSVIVASSIVFVVFIPVIFANLLHRWSEELTN